jgi:ribonucleotide reductase beta subunit family protein with ferritin-like domain
MKAYEADLKWIDYLYETDPELIGLTSNSLKQYSLYNIQDTMSKIGLDPIHSNNMIENPIPWIKKYMNTSNIQTALNETDGVNYLISILDRNIEKW